jgi:hypothetical protein
MHGLRERVRGICHGATIPLSPLEMSRRHDEDEDDAPAVKTDRRTWDKEAYARKALERLEAIAAGEDPDKIDPEDKGIFRAAPAELPRVPGSERAFLQTREKGLNFDAQVGARRVRLDLTAAWLVSVRVLFTLVFPGACGRCRPSENGRILLSSV